MKHRLATSRRLPLRILALLNHCVIAEFVVVVHPPLGQAGTPRAGKMAEATPQRQMGAPQEVPHLLFGCKTDNSQLLTRWYCLSGRKARK